MPHDLNGNLLHVGDTIKITAKIKEIHNTEDYCNCNVEFIHPMPPDGTRQIMSHINTRQVEKV